MPTQTEKGSTAGPSTGNTFDPSFIHALMGTTPDYLSETEDAPLSDEPKAALSVGTQGLGPRDPQLGVQQKIDSLSQLPPADRPFSAGGDTPGWLEQASTPMDASQPYDRSSTFLGQEDRAQEGAENTVRLPS